METEEFRETGHSSLAEFRKEPNRDAHCPSHRRKPPWEPENRELPFRQSSSCQLQLFQTEVRAELLSACSRVKH